MGELSRRTRSQGCLWLYPIFTSLGYCICFGLQDADFHGVLRTSVRLKASFHCMRSASSSAVAEGTFRFASLTTMRWWRCNTYSKRKMSASSAVDHQSTTESTLPGAEKPGSWCMGSIDRHVLPVPQRRSIRCRLCWDLLSGTTVL